MHLNHYSLLLDPVSDTDDRVAGKSGLCYRQRKNGTRGMGTGVMTGGSLTGKLKGLE